MKTILLINGPWNGHCIDDDGAAVIKMGVYNPTYEVGATMGVAVYEPDRSTPGEEKAFWLENNWLGKIKEIIEG